MPSGEQIPVPAELAAGGGYVGRFEDHCIYRFLRPTSVAGRVYSRGAVIAVRRSDVLAGRVAPVPVFLPDDTMFADAFHISAEGMLISGNIGGRSALWTARLAGGRWRVAPVKLPMTGVVRSQVVDTATGDFVTAMETTDRPGIVCVGSIAGGTLKLLGATRRHAGDIVTEQRWATASDGKRAPYFLIRPRGIKGPVPTIIGAYPMGSVNFPRYRPTELALWVRRGGAYVLANGRGSDVMGRVSGLEIRHAYGDVIAIAEDLVKDAVSAPKRLGFHGHSAGGWLAGVLFNRRPDLFGAVVLQHPLVDAFRLDQSVGSGRSFHGPGNFYGDYADPAVLRLNRETSPLQNLHKRLDNPVPLIITSTRDKNVFPTMVRRYGARMEQLGMPFWFREYPDGDHFGDGGIGEMTPLIYTYFHRQLMGRPPR